MVMLDQNASDCTLLLVTNPRTVKLLTVDVINIFKANGTVDSILRTADAIGVELEFRECGS